MNVNEDLSKKLQEEIEEMLQRQKRLFSNKSLISTLPDKGSKIGESIKRLEEELEHRQKVEEVTLALSMLTSNDESSSQMRPADLDSDDDWPGENTNETKHEVDSLQDPFCKQRSEKLQDGTVASNPFRLNKVKRARSEKVKPDWTKLPSDLDPELSALLPVFSETPAQLLTLSESISIQKDQENKLKEVETLRSVERIYERFGPTVKDLPPDAVPQLLYANEPEDSEDENNSDTSEDDEEDLEDETSDTESLMKTIEDAINEAL